MDEAAKACAVGVTTAELDRIVHEACLERDCYPSPLNYYQFPASCCTSVNEVICHGIPDKRPLEDGDLCNGNYYSTNCCCFLFIKNIIVCCTVDVTVYHRGFHGDLNETFFVGNVKPEIKKLVQVTYECLSKAIDIVKPGEKYREIGNVIQKHAQAHGFSVVRSYCGHGIHSELFYFCIFLFKKCFTTTILVDFCRTVSHHAERAALREEQGNWCDEAGPLFHH